MRNSHSFMRLLQFQSSPIRHSLTNRWVLRRPFTTSRPSAEKQTTGSSKLEVGTTKKKNAEFVPKPLNHPLGLSYPPQEGDNTGVDTRTFGQRSRDLVNHEKHMERRKRLATEFSKPYFREWTQMNYHRGKTFIANSRLFKREKALYFPNLFGRTLLQQNPLQDTTPVLRGKVSVITMFSSLWAERQANSFVSQKENPRLHQILNNSGSTQRVDINIEENSLKAWLIRMFMWSMRRKMPQEQHRRYFLVQKGFTNHLKEHIGMMNGKVGYVYLLDESCKIRWAGNSNAEPDELSSLNKGLQKLIEEKELGLATDDAKPTVVPQKAEG